MTRDRAPSLPKRDPNGHKGTFGTVAIVGGCDREGLTMLGAPVLAGRGALRSGVGLCRLAVPATLVTQALTLLPSAMASGFEDSAPAELPACHAAVIGPGLGPAGDRDRPIFDLIKRSDVPTVIDADGLNAIAAGVLANRKLPDLSRCVVTPHPGEYDRLAEAVRLREDPRDPRARESAAYSLAGKLGCTVVLKGSGTVVSDGHRVWVCDRGSPALAAGGTGDVLAGIIGSIIAQTRDAEGFDLLLAACVAVQAHAIAGEQWAESRKGDGGLIASELTELLPGVMNSLRA